VSLFDGCATKSSIDHSLFDTPAATAGVQRRVYQIIHKHACGG
jgi:hypothetical protein